MQPFRLHPMTVQFTTLARTVAFYDQCMRAFETYRALLALDIHVVRYEALVEDPEPVLADLLGWLDVDWHPGVLAQAETAAARGRAVRTASYQQVAEPVYARSRRRWARYAPFMGDALERLEPWRAHFGYA